jgi:hypothetical protein
VKWLLLLGGAAAGLWAWLRARRRESTSEQPPATVTPITPPSAAEPVPAADADPAVREAESRLEDETKYDREGEAEVEKRHEASERVKEDPLTERVESPPDDAA